MSVVRHWVQVDAACVILCVLIDKKPFVESYRLFLMVLVSRDRSMRALWNCKRIHICCFCLSGANVCSSWLQITKEIEGRIVCLKQAALTPAFFAHFLNDFHLQF